MVSCSIPPGLPNRVTPRQMYIAYRLRWISCLVAFGPVPEEYNPPTCKQNDADMERHKFLRNPTSRFHPREDFPVVGACGARPKDYPGQTHSAKEPSPERLRPSSEDSDGRLFAQGHAPHAPSDGKFVLGKIPRTGYSARFTDTISWQALVASQRENSLGCSIFLLYAIIYDALYQSRSGGNPCAISISPDPDIDPERPSSP